MAQIALELEILLPQPPGGAETPASRPVSLHSELCLKDFHRALYYRLTSLTLGLVVCLWGGWVCAHVCASLSHTHTHMHVHIRTQPCGSQGAWQSAFLSPAPRIFGDGLSLNPELSNSARLADQGIIGFLLSTPAPPLSTPERCRGHWGFAGLLGC